MYVMQNKHVTQTRQVSREAKTSTFIMKFTTAAHSIWLEQTEIERE